VSAAILGLVHAGLIPTGLTPAMATSTASIGTAESTLFWFVAPLSVIGALGMLLSRKAVHSALWLALTMCSLAILYIAQGAPFLGIVQIVVYTGAVMMLFLFVLMLVGVDASDSLVETIRGQRAWALIGGLGFALLLLGALGHVAVDNIVGLQGVENAAGGNLQAIAQAIFGRYLFAFEVTSALLITAALGAMILAHRERVTPKPTQRELSERRTHSDLVTPMPAPGVYARHNAVDTPALLPDGTPSEASVPRPMQVRGIVREFQTAQGRSIAPVLADPNAIGPEPGAHVDVDALADAANDGHASDGDGGEQE
jgi:NADH-quinone oxidoreductase subunit J